MTRKQKKVDGWTDRMKGVPCFLIGCGTSLIDVELDILKPYFTIGLNRAFYKIDPTVIMWQDLGMWMEEGKKIKNLKAIKYCREASYMETERGDQKFYKFRLVGRDNKLTGIPSLLYGRGSSGGIGYQLAHILGCNPIVLVGMDCRKRKKNIEKKEKKMTSFYGNNPKYRDLTLKNCVKSLEWIKKVGESRTIISCSKGKVFAESISIKEAVNTIKNIEPHSRKYWKKKLFGKELPEE